ncbi:MAG: energy-coupling factor transporter ATPase [Ruminococcaceae bacterium]|nr:energy-coupling factor transporter ATPase [Oscillospiraceae bacterium]
MYAIEAQNLTYTYGIKTPFEKTAIRDVSVQIPAGEFVGVIGHTGSGKSTLIQHINGLLRPTSGKLLLNGKDIWENPKEIRKVRFSAGLVFQYPEHQLFETTVYKDIAFGPTNMGLSEEEVRLRVEEAAEFTGISSALMDQSPFELSGGQKRRVAIAGVIAMRPEVLILDEPTAGLDPRGRDKILDRLRRYHQAQKNTVLLVSHSMEDVAEYCTSALVMNRGTLFAYDTVENVFSRTEELEQMGLAIPAITQVFHRLAAAGIPVSRNVFTMDAAKQALSAALEGRGRNA